MAHEKDQKKIVGEAGALVQVSAVPATIVPAVATPEPLVETVPARIFRDKVFTSRTLIMPDGGSLPVSLGQVTAFGDDQFDYLKAHPEFELIED